MSGKANIRKLPKRSQHVENEIVNGRKVKRIVDDSKPKTQSSTKK